ncbi:hypothetical protein [Flavobacterium soyae]|uniref:hypothetical protein n=1 Tax=Flavobacterium soyae TaxID=2903098 RepID=UPI001E4A421A|nr:hypothetical protein [Flavobacterium soyae]MCD9576977.1 hypothetical protein [Flavobacterium soyae]
MNTILENIRLLAVNERITISKLEQVIGASKGVLSRAISNNSDIQAKWILKIVEKYPQYSCEWLLKSEGPMIMGANDENYHSDINQNEDEKSYKSLAESRKETIESLQKVIFLLEKQVPDNEKK